MRNSHCGLPDVDAVDENRPPPRSPGAFQLPSEVGVGECDVLFGPQSRRGPLCCLSREEGYEEGNPAPVGWVTVGLEIKEERQVT